MCLLHSTAVMVIGFSALVLYAWVPEGSELDFAQRLQSLRWFPPPECNCGVRNRCQFWTILCCLIFHFRVTIMLRLHWAFTSVLFFIVFTDFCNLLWLLIDAFWTELPGWHGKVSSPITVWEEHFPVLMNNSTNCELLPSWCRKPEDYYIYKAKPNEWCDTYHVCVVASVRKKKLFSFNNIHTCSLAILQVSLHFTRSNRFVY